MAARIVLPSGMETEKVNAMECITGWGRVRKIVKVGASLFAAATAALIVCSTGASAKVLFRDDLSTENALRVVNGGKFLATSKGTGWVGTKFAWPHAGQKGFSGSENITYRIGSEQIPSREGTIEILAVNNSRNNSAYEADALLELASAKEKNSLWVITVNWNGEGGTVIGFEGKQHSSDQFSSDVVIPQIAKGERLHLVLRWDDGRLTRSVEANGTVYNVVMPVENIGGGRIKEKTKKPFNSVLKRADTVRLGILSNHPDFWPDGEMPNNDTVILAIALHDNSSDAAILVQPPGIASTIASIEHNALKVSGFSGKLVAGDALQVDLTGSAKAPGGFDVARLADDYGKIALDWRGYGVYLEEKVFYEPGEVNLRDVSEYRVYVSEKPFDEITAEMVPVQTLKVGEQSCTIESLRLDTPYFVAVTALMRDQSVKKVISPLVNIPMIETAAGLYQGSYLVTYQDRYPRAVVVGHLGVGTGEAFLQAERVFEIDPALNVAVEASPNELQADEKSTSSVSVTLTDANGNPVSGHKVKFVLATTSQYTGVVGGGAFAEQMGGTIQEGFFGESDLFGKLTATYVAGFAAKTAIIVARDMLSNDTGAGYVKTYIKATAELELTPPVNTQADTGYQIVVTSSDGWLTADGKSQARITAKVTRFGVPVEGHKINFNASSGSGSIRVVKDTTDSNGVARAVYTAGKKIGIVLITATDDLAGISGSVQIELRSDAPAKIVIKVNPEKIPADGHSTAKLQVTVTDINDNPNDNTEIEYRIAQGGGKLRDDKTVSDKSGESSTTYQAGREAGKVTFELTVRSTVPSDEELVAARLLAVATTDYDFF